MTVWKMPDTSGPLLMRHVEAAGFDPKARRSFYLYRSDLPVPIWKNFSGNIVSCYDT